MICLVNFDEDSLVTPLPCDIRHYFHTTCIEQWLMINASCPLCKSPVTMEEIERVAQMYQRKLNHHEKCCSEPHVSERRSNFSSASESKNCDSQFHVGSHFYNQTLINYNSNNSSQRSLGSLRQGNRGRQENLEMSV